jgi:transcriptional regulator with XRE-family HTH domain
MNIDEISTDALLRLLGERLRLARLEANLTQESLANRVGVSTKTVRNAEDGQNISLQTLALLLEGMGRLDAFREFLLPQGPSPIELAERKGRQRQRATGRRGEDQAQDSDWKW